MFHDLPFNWGTGVQFLIMDELCKCGFVFTGLDSEVAGVFIVPGLKRTICYTYTLLRETAVLTRKLLVSNIDR